MKEKNINELKKIHNLLETLVVPMGTARQIILCTDMIRTIIEDEESKEEPKKGK